MKHVIITCAVLAAAVLRAGDLISDTDARTNWRWLIPPRFDTVGSFHDGLAAVKLGSYWGYIDSAGHAVIPFSFEQAGDYASGRAPVRAAGRWRFIRPGAITAVVPTFDSICPFQDGLARVQRNGKWGVIDTSDAMVCDCRFDEIDTLAGARARIRIRGFYGYLNRQGDAVIPVHYRSAGVFNNGRALVLHDSATRLFIDTSGKEIVRLDLLTDSAQQFSENLAPVRSTVVPHGWGYLDTAGYRVIESRYAAAGDFSEGLAPVRILPAANPHGQEHSFSWGYIDCRGKMVILPAFDAVRRFAAGVAAVNLGAESDSSGLSAGGKWGLIDHQGHYVLPPSCDDVGEFSSEGVALVRTGARWNSRLKVLQGGRFGYVSCHGEEIARGEFSSALPWREGSGAVKRQHSWGFIVTNKGD